MKRSSLLLVFITSAFAASPDDVLSQPVVLRLEQAPPEAPQIRLTPVPSPGGPLRQFRVFLFREPLMISERVKSPLFSEPPDRRIDAPGPGYREMTGR